MNDFFLFLDRNGFLNINFWDFLWHSLPREYAWLFMRKAIFTHPRRTLRGLRAYRSLVRREDKLSSAYSESISLPDTDSLVDKLKQKNIAPLVGLGFCLKPQIPGDPALDCPSRRPNHDCFWLETGKDFPACSGCAISRIALKCREAGSPVYIMTSARDIALDFLIPQISSGKFPAAFLLLCPYSVQAIIPALLICGVDVYLAAYSRGYCRDYPQWLKADRGQKEEMSYLAPETEEKLFGLLNRTGRQGESCRRFRRQGNIFFPE